jgi:hypothetical protein
MHEDVEITDKCKRKFKIFLKERELRSLNSTTLTVSLYSFFSNNTNYEVVCPVGGYGHEGRSP